MKLKVLQITDFHFENTSRSIRKQQDLLKELEKEIPKVDVVLFTGDLVNKGGASAKDFYTAGSILFDFLIEKGVVQREKIILTPGNHDVRREEAWESVVKMMDDSIKSDADIEAFLEKKEFETSLAPLKDYLDYQNEFYSGVAKSKVESLYSAHVIDIENSSIGVVSINTAWRAIGNNDVGNLIFPESKLSEAIDFIKSCDFKILIHHHPLADFKGFNASTIEEIAQNHFDAIFSGHTHKTKGSIEFTSFDGLITLAAPASLNQQGEQKGVGYVSFDLEEGCFEGENVFYDSTNGVCYKKAFGPYDIPTTHEKAKLVKFKRKISAKYYDENYDAWNLLVSADRDGGEDQAFLDWCTEPVLKKKSLAQLYEDQSSEPDFNWEDFNYSNKDFLILGRDKCGKTTLLKRIQLNLLKFYSQFGVVPVYIDCDEYNLDFKEKPLVDFLRRYLNISKADADNLLRNDRVLLLLDNYNPKNERQSTRIEGIVGWVSTNENIKVIAAGDETALMSFEGVSIDGRNFEKLYFHRLRKKHIKDLTCRAYNIPVSKQEDIVEKIESIFNRLSIPFNFWTVSLFLWVFKRDGNSNFQNDVELINLYIEKLLEKDRLAIEKTAFGFNKYKKFLAHLAHKLLTEHHENTYAISEKELFNFTTDYLEANPRYNITTREVLDYVEERGVIKKRADGYMSFRLNGVFEYFIATYMGYDQGFLKKALGDDNLYLSFANEFELYGGFRREDKRFLIEIYDKTKKVLNELTIEYADGELDEQLVEKVKSEDRIRELTSAVSESLKEGLSVEEQDQLEDQMIKEGGVDDNLKSQVRKKELRKLDQSFDSLERALFVLGRVFKNVDEVDDTKLVYEIFDYIIDHAAFLGLRVVDELREDNNTRGKKADRVRELLKLLTSLIPTVIEVRLNEMIGHKSIEGVVEYKISELVKNPAKNQLKLFMLYLLLCDISLKQHYEKLKELSQFIKIPILRYSIILKLNYYQAFKVNEDQDLKRALKSLIQEEHKKFNNKTDIGALQQSLSEKEKRNRFNKGKM